MKTKINLHSVIDLITNSSTEIYTYSSGSIKACKEMINEFFKAVGIEKTCDDIFDLSLETNDYAPEDYDAQTFLVIEPKKEEYTKLATLVKDFLYSTHHEACYNG